MRQKEKKIDRTLEDEVVSQVNDSQFGMHQVKNTLAVNANILGAVMSANGENNGDGTGPKSYGLKKGKNDDPKKVNFVGPSNTQKENQTAPSIRLNPLSEVAGSMNLTMSKYEQMGVKGAFIYVCLLAVLNPKIEDSKYNSWIRKLDDTASQLLKNPASRKGYTDLINEFASEILPVNLKLAQHLSQTIARFQSKKMKTAQADKKSASGAADEFVNQGHDQEVSGRIKWEDPLGMLDPSWKAMGAILGSIQWETNTRLGSIKIQHDQGGFGKEEEYGIMRFIKMALSVSRDRFNFLFPCLKNFTHFCHEGLDKAAICFAECIYKYKNQLIQNINAIRQGASIKDVIIKTPINIIPIFIVIIFITLEFISPMLENKRIASDKDSPEFNQCVNGHRTEDQPGVRYILLNCLKCAKSVLCAENRIEYLKATKNVHQELNFGFIMKLINIFIVAIKNYIHEENEVKQIEGDISWAKESQETASYERGRSWESSVDSRDRYQKQINEGSSRLDLWKRSADRAMNEIYNYPEKLKEQKDSENVPLSAIRQSGEIKEKPMVVHGSISRSYFEQKEIIKSMILLNKDNKYNHVGFFLIPQDFNLDRFMRSMKVEPISINVPYKSADSNDITEMKLWLSSASGALVIYIQGEKEGVSDTEIIENAESQLMKLLYGEKPLEGSESLIERFREIYGKIDGLKEKDTKFYPALLVDHYDTKDLQHSQDYVRHIPRINASEFEEMLKKENNSSAIIGQLTEDHSAVTNSMANRMLVDMGAFNEVWKKANAFNMIKGGEIIISWENFNKSSKSDMKEFIEYMHSPERQIEVHLKVSSSNIKLMPDLNAFPFDGIIFDKPSENDMEFLEDLAFKHENMLLAVMDPARMPNNAGIKVIKTVEINEESDKQSLESGVNEILDIRVPEGTSLETFQNKMSLLPYSATVIFTMNDLRTLLHNEDDIETRLDILNKFKGLFALINPTAESEKEAVYRWDWGKLDVDQLKAVADASQNIENAEALLQDTVVGRHIQGMDQKLKQAYLNAMAKRLQIKQNLLGILEEMLKIQKEKGIEEDRKTAQAIVDDFNKKALKLGTEKYEEKLLETTGLMKAALNLESPDPATLSGIIELNRPAGRRQD